MPSARLHATAPELRIQSWIDSAGAPRAPLTLAELGAGPKVLFAFQHWCPGCHSRGFPTLRRLHRALAPRGVGFAAIQTVFEGEAVNTADKLRTNQIAYDLPIPFGHDPAAGDRRLPSFLEDYCTGGTPWFTVIGADGRILFSDFHLDAERLLPGLIAPELDFAPPAPALPPQCAL